MGARYIDRLLEVLCSASSWHKNVELLDISFNLVISSTMTVQYVDIVVIACKSFESMVPWFVLLKMS